MNLLKWTLIPVLMVLLVSCAGDTTKVVIMSSGKIKVDPAANTITLEAGTQHNEEIMEVAGGEKATVTVKTASGDKTVELPEKGLYLLNLKQNDTLVGGVVKYGASSGRERITDQELTHIIDSTRRLIMGQGASDQTKTYFVLPFLAKKISDNTDATVVGPFKGLPYKVEGKEGNGPEVYKIYTNKQQRESLLDLVNRMK
ncbi:MAG: hypothetical protein H7Y03_15020 [Chitinophagaceae bacterium]|nr:hypothetical protein [Chitinophagaceae bacterium]